MTSDLCERPVAWQVRYLADLGINQSHILVLLSFPHFFSSSLSFLLLPEQIFWIYLSHFSMIESYEAD